MKPFGDPHSINSIFLSLGKVMRIPKRTTSRNIFDIGNISVNFCLVQGALRIELSNWEWDFVKSSLKCVKIGDILCNEAKS